MTRRYARAYNAKTRRNRVAASGEEGVRWWKRVLRFFRRRGGQLDREQVEDAELSQKEAREGLPSNVQDFKDHPVYALDRHLKRHEVIHPRREVGRVNAGSAAKPRMEAVFRRQDVLPCRSADKWYRLGREVKKGEQPLKHVVARSMGRRARSPSADDDEEDARSNTTALYAPYQTELYTPPPVTRGRVPRNGFGNLDIYTPSMVPAGGMHIRHPLTAQAAKLLRVDYADAVTGFKFQGRQGTAIVEGAVVPSAFAEAVRAVVEGLVWEEALEVSRRRSALAMRVWKRFLMGLRIKERVSAYGDRSKEKNAMVKEGEESVDVSGEDANVNGVLTEDEEGLELPTAGQYTLDGLTVSTKRAAVPRKKRKVEDSDDEEIVDDVSDEQAGQESLDENPDADYGGGGFFPDGDDVSGGGGGFMPDGDGGGGGCLANDPGDDDGAGGGFLVPDEEEVGTARDYLNDHSEGVHGGGFVPEDEHEQSGGFLPEGEENEGHDPAAVSTTPGGVQTGKVGPPPGSANSSRHEMEEPSAHRTGRDHVTAIQADNAPAPSFATTPQTPGGARPGASAGNKDQQKNEAAAQLDCQSGEVQQQQDTSSGDRIANVDAEEAGRASGEESDRGSLLSHDPEDDDAEPDWLESD